ncbi:hypothetical protein MNB_ARC-1_156 [hydrothermal vent metagenome]|uniref:Prokaryotic metallothionein n=1 Tax=hydrothermal vent metagenome TaxID=652676 RepID=A0A3B1DWF7_9ZZZZ
MIFKLIAFLIVIFMIYIVFFKKSREENIKEKKYDKITDTMVECPSCKTYVSKNDAILSSGKYFCNSECVA